MHLCGKHFVTGNLSFCFSLALAFVGLVASLLCFALLCFEESLFDCSS
jgi:hypothetical protein